MKTLTATTNKGESLQAGFAPFHLVSFEGYGETDADNILIKGIRTDGVRYVESFLEPKQIPIVLKIVANGEVELNNRRQEVGRIFNPKNGLLTLTFEDENGPKEIKAVSEHVPKFGGSDQRRDGIFQNVLITMLAPHPYWRKTEAIQKPLFSWVPRFRFPNVLGVESDLIQTDYKNKIAGDFLANSNRYRSRVGATTTAPDNFTAEVVQASYDYIEFLGDGLKSGPSAGGSGNYMQVLFSFDVLRMLEQEYGPDVWQGAGTITDQINVAKTKTKQLQYNFHGHGKGAGANGINMYIWNVATQSYTLWGSNAAADITLLTGYSKDSYSSNTPENVIDSVGYVHVLMTAPASDGVVNSNVYTDYIEMLLTTKNTTRNTTMFGVKGTAESLENTGGDGAPIILTITGYVDTPTVTNLTTGEKITLNTIINEGERVEINTDDQDLIIDLIDIEGVRTDIYYRQSNDSTLWKLVQGENVIEFTSLSQTDRASVSVTYQELYAGI